MGDTQQTWNPVQRRIGIAVPVGALRGAGSIGVGEFPDLAEMAELCGKMDAGLLQLLPVNDTGYESSPYSALTVFALHPLYLKIGDLDELQPDASTGNPQAAQFKERLSALRDEFEGNARFPFQKLLRAKLELLREIYAAYQSAIRRRAENGSLGDWIARNPWVKEYAVYRRLKEANGEKS